MTAPDTGKDGSAVLKASLREADRERERLLKKVDGGPMRYAIPWPGDPIVCSSIPNSRQIVPLREELLDCQLVAKSGRSVRWIGTS